MTTQDDMTRKRQRTVAWVVGISMVGLMFDGYDLVVYGTVVSTFLRDPSHLGPVDPALAGALGSYALLGVLFGALLAGTFNDRIGRRRTMLGAYAWFSVGMLATALTHTATTFGIFRFMTGLGVGALLATTAAMVSEYAPPGKKNLYNTIAYNGVPLGSLAAAALAILDDVRDRLVVETSLGKVLLPGPEGFVRDGSVVLNPSYWVFPALDAFARRHDRDLWRAVSDSGRALVARARFGEAGLPPDWVELAGTELRLPSGFETVFGFNAIRVPLYAIWGGLDDADALNRPVVSWWSGHDGAPFIPATVDLATDAKAPYGLSGGGRAVSVLTRFRGEALPMLPSIGDTDDYYSATLILLTKIAFSERFL